MRNKLLAAALLCLPAYSQVIFPPGNGTGGGVGVGAPNPFTTIAGTSTTMSVAVTSLNMTTVEPALLGCKTATGPVAYTFTTTGAAPITAVNFTYASTAGVTCTVNSTGGAGSTGATGPAANNAHVTFAAVTGVDATVAGASSLAVVNCWDTVASPTKAFIPIVTVTDANTIHADFAGLTKTGYCNVSTGAGVAGPAGPTGQTGQTGLTGAAGPAGNPIDVNTFASSAGFTRLASAHLQGTKPLYQCWDTSVSPSVKFDPASVTRNASGDMVFVFSPVKTGECDLFTGAGGSPGAAGPNNNLLGTTITGLQGNGLKAQMSTGSTTNNNCVKFDSTGNTVDAGVACNAGGIGTLTGDVSNSGQATTVLALRNRALSSTAPTNSQALVYNSGTGQWEPQNQSGSGTNATQFQSRNMASTAPADTNTICWDASGSTWKPCTAGGGGGASSVTQLTDLQVTRTNSTTLAVAAGNVMVSGISYLIPTGTVGISAGSGTVRIGIDTSVTPPIGKVYYSSGLTVTCSGMGGCTTPVSGSAFGVDDLQDFTWTTTSGTFDISGASDLRPILSKGRTLAGTGISSSTSGHTQTLSVNTAVIPIFTLVPGTGTALASGSTITPTSRGHHVTGTAAIATITATGMIDGEILTLIPDAIFTTTTGGNIGLASTAVVSRAIRFYWDSTAVKWFPSY